ncbi:hypothetical protein PVL29_010398 [Vitis rotundifolia]|uniref:Pentatricopeptide repeat-containing protein n=1 Tax=Vitis rotundifolia TaxID=103349 RepID=A0AA38ZTC1_VITRO|nr:hypothetical protein PVL29_010398 [Vitis rotundifolia]
MHEIFGCQPGKISYNSLLNAFIQKKQFEKAKEPLNWMWEQGLKPYVFSYGTLINALAKNGYISHALKLFDEMPERGVTPDATCYNILIDGFFKKGDLLNANEIWERLFTQTFFLVTLLSMVSVNVGRLDESLEIWRSMKENERVQDLFTYITLIHELCGSGNLDGAIRVYKGMFKGGVSPDVVVHNTMLNREFRVGRIKECLELWKVMGNDGCWLFENRKVDEAISIRELLPEKGCCTDSTTYGILIHGLCKNGCSNKALSSLEEAENGGPDSDTFACSSMISGLGREGRLDGVVGILDRMTKHGCRPNPHVSNAVINGFVRASKLEYAIRFFGGMVNNLVKEMLQKGWKPDTITYSLLMNGLCQDKLDMALNFWFQALERRVSSQIYIKKTRQWNNVPDLVTHNTIMKGFYKVKDFEKAPEIWDCILQNGILPDIIPYNITLEGLCSYYRISGAIGFLDEAVDRGVLPTAITWNILVREVLDNRALT